MNLQTYQTLIEKIGVDNLPTQHQDAYDLVKNGSANFSNNDQWKMMLEDADIRETYELHVAELKKLQSEEMPVMQVSSRKETTKTKTKVAKPKKEKKASPLKVSKPKPIKTKKIAKAKKLKVAKPKATKVKKELKFPITIKRFSKELQVIKRVVNMDEKEKTLHSLKLFHRDIEKLLGTQPDRKPVLNDIFNRLTGVIKSVEKANIDKVKITLKEDFKEKLKAQLFQVKPKMKVEYLAGVEGKK
ncbi:MAG: hypothetical protein O9302_03385 [Cyclobacteriaceae bacterium]|nr:hypothetical protein [Cyclobacteriaceae bacterium]